MVHPMFVKHQDLLGRAVHAIESRACWSPYAEDFQAYGANAVEEGREAFQAYPDAQFYLDQPGLVGRGGGEISPYGFALNVSYPKCSADALISAGKAAMPAWTKAGPDVRAGVCAEILARLNAGSMELAHAVMHTTGQSFVRAFRHGCPQAQARGLEAVAWAWREMKHMPYYAVWEHSRGARPPLRLHKRYTAVPRGVALTLACASAPTWASYAGIFASLATGNAVIVKPHPAAVLPLAITVAVARQALKEAGFDANLVSLLVDTAEAPVARDVAVKPDIRIVDYAGNADFGRWLESHARQAVVFATKAGINSVVVDSTDDYAGMIDDIVAALALDAGQGFMAPRLLFLPHHGVHAEFGTVAPERFCRDLAAAVGRLIEQPARVFDLLGAMRGPALVQLEATADLGETVRAANALEHPQWPQAVVRSPLLCRMTLADGAAWMEERLGPVAFIIETATTAESLAAAERAMRERGALAFALYSTNENVAHLAIEAGVRSRVPLSINLTGGETDAFSDVQSMDASGFPSDAAFVSSRFCVVQSSRHIA
jgi:phenylacetic acid degradation protein paaN